MRGGALATVVFLALLGAVPQAGASGPPVAPVTSMTVAVSPRAAGAHAIRLTLTLRYEMQCGYPGAGPLVVTFPAGLSLPQRFAAGTVRLGDKPIAAQVEKRRVTVTIPPHKGMLCNVVGPGSVRLGFTRAAKLANPARAGSYTVRAVHGGRTFAAVLVIKPSTA